MPRPKLSNKNDYFVDISFQVAFFELLIIYIRSQQQCYGVNNRVMFL